MKTVVGQRFINPPLLKNLGSFTVCLLFKINQSLGIKTAGFFLYNVVYILGRQSVMNVSKTIFYLNSFDSNVYKDPDKMESIEFHTEDSLMSIGQCFNYLSTA